MKSYCIVRHVLQCTGIHLCGASDLRPPDCRDLPYLGTSITDDHIQYVFFDIDTSLLSCDTTSLQYHAVLFASGFCLRLLLAGIVL